MADNTFGDNPINRSREMADAFASAQSSASQLQSALRGSDTIAENIRLSFSSLVNSADKVALVQQQTEKSTKGTAEAMKQYNYALAQSRKLAADANRIYEESKGHTGITRTNLLKLSENTLNAATAARDLADLYEQLAIKSSEYDENTKRFADHAAILKKLAPSLAAPYELAAQRAREIAVQNAKIEAQNDRIRKTNELIEYTKEGVKGLTKARVEELGFQDLLVDGEGNVLAGTAAILKARKLGLLQHREEIALIDSSKLGVEAIKETLSSKAFQLGLAIAAFKGLLKLILKVDEQITKLAKSTGMSYREAAAYRNELQVAAVRNLDLVNTTRNLLEAQYELADVAGATRGFKVEELKTQAALTHRVGLQADTAAKLAVMSRINGKNADSILRATIRQTNELASQEGIMLDRKGILKEVAEIEGQIAANYANNPNLISAAVIQVRRLGLTLAQAASASSKLLDFESSIEAELEAELLTGRSLNLERARSLALQGKSAEAAAELAKNFSSLEEFQSMSVIAQNAYAKAIGMTADELANSLVQQRNLNNLGVEARRLLDARVEKLIAAGKVEEANRLMSQAYNDEEVYASEMRLDAQKKLNLLLEKMSDFFLSLVDDYFPYLLGALGAIAGIMAAIAASVVVATGGLALVGAGIGAVVGAGVGLSMDYAQDGIIDPNGGLVVSGRKGSIQLDKDDSIIAGTNLGGGSSNSELLKRMDRLISLVEKGGDVYMDGNKVGYSLALAATKQ